MKYILLFATLIYAALAPAETFEERLAELNADPDVLEAVEQSAPAPIGGFAGLWTASISYVSVAGDVAQRNTVDLVGIADGEQGEAWYWARRVPDVLTNGPVGLFADRTAGNITAAQVQTFANSTWATANAGAASIRNFSVTAIDGKTVQVSGTFNVPNDPLPWQARSYYIRLVDANGSVTPGNANIKFERVN